MGYKKHTLRLWLRTKGKNLLIPLVSFIEPANVYEGNFISPMIRNAQKELSLHIDIVVGDMGYISSDHKRELRKQSQTAVITKVRENMFPPEAYVDHGCPECPEGIPLLWDGYEMISAYKEAEVKGLGAVSFGGRMIGYAMVSMGKDLLSRAEAIAEKEKRRLDLND